MSDYTDLKLSPVDSGVLLIRLHRPETRNSLRTHLLGELADALERAQSDDEVRCVVVTGGEKVFAAGADVKEMADFDAVELWKDVRPEHWKRIRRFPKPLIAAVNGYCLGGGFELAMHADIIVAGETARFGQPEINLAIIPGAGGTQRLIRAVGKSVAMKMILSGEPISAREALACGVAAEVTQPELTIERACRLAETIAAKSPLAVRIAKETVLRAFETPLEQGLDAERLAFLFLATSADRHEGLNAFLERRKPRFEGR